jgi:hypothetical protein
MPAQRLPSRDLHGITHLVVTVTSIEVLLVAGKVTTLPAGSDRTGETRRAVTSLATIVRPRVT